MPTRRSKASRGDRGQGPPSALPPGAAPPAHSGPAGRGSGGGPAQGRAESRSESGGGSAPGIAPGAGRGRSGGVGEGGGNDHPQSQPQPGAEILAQAQAQAHSQPQPQPQPQRHPQAPVQPQVQSQPQPGVDANLSAGRRAQVAVTGGGRAASGELQAVQVAGLVEGTAGLHLDVVPAAAKILKYPSRPGYGRIGSPFKVKANYFLVKVQENRSPQHYHVLITPEVVSRSLNRLLIALMLRLYGGEFGGRMPVYDGRSSLYSAGKLPFDCKTFVVSPDEERGREREETANDVKPRKERKYNITIKFARTVDVAQWRLFREGKTSDLPQELIQELDIVLRERPTLNYSPIGRSFYSPNLGGVVNLGDGLVGWRGFFQSVRPVQMGLSLNVNVSATALLGEMHVIDFLRERDRTLDEKRALTEAQCREIGRTLRGVKVEVTHRGEMRRKHRVFKLTDVTTGELTFADSGGQQISVVQYFKNKYDKELRWTRLPCLDVGSASRPNYLPMELCRILPGQRYPGRMLGERARSGLLEMTSQSPADRERDILNIVNLNQYMKDSYAREFGMQVSDKIVTVDARLLPPPTLLYGTGHSVQPVNGAWNMMGKVQFHSGGRVDRWAAVNFSHLSNDDTFRFFQALVRKCTDLGMHFNTSPVFPIANLPPNANKFTDFMKNKDVDLLLVALPDIRYDWYAELKRICETNIGVMSQCCSAKHVRMGKDQYMANVAMKINVKMGGRNNVLVEAVSSKLPTLGATPTIIFGADVTHPSPGDDGISIAAVVASQDWPYVSTYAGLISSQKSRVEQILKLEGMVRTLLMSFYSQSKMKPGRILFYRDGVSEGQFQIVLSNELTAIQRACHSLEADYNPLVTFVVVQKRHHTRFFPFSRDEMYRDRKGNIKAGTVVDSGVCHPTEFDFYLCSHAGLKGTSRPTHYHVLYDDNRFSADSLQTLTNYLCSTYARCTRSVSIVPPAYYAHHLAFRARCYIGPGDTEVPNPAPKIRHKMFYC